MGKTTILLVEDEAIIAESLASKLNLLGYEVAGTAAQGHEAVEMALRMHPQLILMDIRLEGPLDGIQAAQAIRDKYDVPVIYLTAHSDSDTLSRAKLTGPSGYIVKPFKIHDLATQIELALYKHQTDRKLYEQREWLRTTLTSIGDAVVAADARGLVTFINPVAEELTGWSMAEATGQPVQEVFHIINEYSRAPVDDPVSKVLRTGKIVGLANHTVLIRKDGREMPIDDSGAPIRDREGNVQGAVLVFRDISERRQTEEALRDLNETLERRVAERTELAEARARQLQALAAELIETEDQERRRIADLLHDDLQQTLAAARLHLQEVREHLPPEPTLEYVQQLLDESLNKSRQLSHDLSPPVLLHCDLLGALQWLGRHMNDQFGLEVHLQADVNPQLHRDSLKRFLFRAVNEHLFNVVKHAGVKSARVILSATDGGFIVTVSDQGKGFDPHILDSQNLKYGLGITRVRERLRALGGTLEIESTPGQGSRFTLTVPLRIAETDTVEETQSKMKECEDAIQAESPEGGVIRTLLVDDHLVMRKGLLQLLSNQPDIQVVGEAENGLEAIDRTRQLKPDVVVMDISMPVMGGIEATRQIKAEMPWVRVIGLSMYEDEQIAATLTEAGGECLVNKAASLSGLLKAVHGTANANGKVGFCPSD